jgi:hypothetical protein
MHMPVAGLTICWLNVVEPFAEYIANIGQVGTVGPVALSPWSTGGCLPNFMASTDRADIESMYATDTRSRLAALTATYDPNDVIAAAQPIRDSVLS